MDIQYYLSDFLPLASHSGIYKEKSPEFALKIFAKNFTVGGSKICGACMYKFRIVASVYFEIVFLISLNKYLMINIFILKLILNVTIFDILFF